MTTTHRAQWETICAQVSDTGDENLKTGLVIAMENASATVAVEGLTNQHELWFETAVWTWRQWEDTPWGLDDTDT